MRLEHLALRGNDGTELHVGAHPAAGTGPVVLILHGLFSHAGWYRGLGDQLAAVGAAVYLLDRRGAGRSGGPRGHMPSWRVLVDDVRLVCRHIRSLHFGRPLHVIGISLGGVISLACSIVHTDLFASQILLSPGLAAQYRLPLHRRARLLQRSLLQPRKLYDLPFSMEALTDQAQWRQALAADPLRTRSVTARFLVETFRLQQFVRREIERVQVPLLALLAADDQLVDNEVTLATLRRSRSPRLRMEIFDGASHVLPACVPGAEMLGRFRTWLDHPAPAAREAAEVVRVPPFRAPDLATCAPPELAPAEEGNA